MGQLEWATQNWPVVMGQTVWDTDYRPTGRVIFDYRDSRDRV